MAVGRDVEAAVVVQIEGRESGIDRQRRAVVVPLAPPLSTVHAQPVRQHEDPAGGLRERRGEGRGRQVERPPVTPQPHGNRQRVGAGCQVIAQHAVGSRLQRLALVRSRSGIERPIEQRQQRIEADTYQTRRAAIVR